MKKTTWIYTALLSGLLGWQACSSNQRPDRAFDESLFDSTRAVGSDNFLAVDSPQAAGRFKPGVLPGPGMRLFRVPAGFAEDRYRAQGRLRGTGAGRFEFYATEPETLVVELPFPTPLTMPSNTLETYPGEIDLYYRSSATGADEALRLSAAGVPQIIYGWQTGETAQQLGVEKDVWLRQVPVRINGAGNRPVPLVLYTDAGPVDLQTGVSFSFKKNHSAYRVYVQTSLYAGPESPGSDGPNGYTLQAVISKV